MTRKDNEKAQDLAAAALGFIAADRQLCESFLAEAGLSVADLAAAAKQPDFSAFVLDFLAADDARLIEFARAERIQPADIMRARALLSGPGSENWVPD